MGWLTHANAHVRPSWQHSVISRMQVAAFDTSVMLDRDHPRATLRAFVRSIETPVTAAERSLLQALLLDFASRFAVTFHRAFHHSDLATCEFSASLLRRYEPQVDSDATSAFDLWANDFFDRFDAAHPLSLAEKTSRLLRNSYTTVISIDTVASRLSATAHVIMKTFRQEYGVTPHEYVRALRVAAAVAALADDKIEATAICVGYQSRKNLSAALLSLTGYTAAEIRRLSAPERLLVLDAVQRMLTREKSYGVMAAQPGR